MLGVSIPTARTPRCNQPAGGRRVDPGEVQLLHSLGPGPRGTEIPDPVGPVPRPPGTKEHDGSRRNRALLSFPFIQRVQIHSVVGAAVRTGLDVNDNRVAHQTVQRNLVGGPLALRKVHRGVQMRSPVLGGAEVVRGVVIAGRAFVGPIRPPA